MDHAHNADWTTMKWCHCAECWFRIPKWIGPDVFFLGQNAEAQIKALALLGGVVLGMVHGLEEIGGGD